MKNKLEIFSTDKLKDFFLNLEGFFDISLKDYEQLETSSEQNNLSLVFLDDETTISKKILNKIRENENFIFVCKNFSIFQKLHLSQKNTLISPVPVKRIIDIINTSINNKTYLYFNIELNNNVVTNKKSNETIYLTQAERQILQKLFSEKNVNKKALEKDALQIKQDLNTSSMESHLNRIRKKLKKIGSEFTISSKDKDVYLESFNLDT